MADHQPSLFDNAERVPIPAVELPRIAGLQYVPDFIARETHDQLLLDVDAQPWLTDLKRRVQHYGYKYDYKARKIDQSMRIGPLPDWSLRIAEDMVKRGLMPELPDQLIVNEYQPGQGIAPHVDCVPCFTDTIASLSLGSACVMNFSNKDTKENIPLVLDPGSLVILKGEARYNWTHGIAARKTDEYQGRTIERQRRVSLTFRKVILDNPQAAGRQDPALAPQQVDRGADHGVHVGLRQRLFAPAGVFQGIKGDMLRAVVGLPGSGKSMMMMHADKGWIVLDDMGDNLTWEGDAWTKNTNLVRHCLAQGYKVIVSDVGFCKDECRADFQRGFPAVQWVFFANDPAACIENVRRRCGTEWRSHSLEDEIASIQQLSLNYHPTGETIPCYRPGEG